MRINMPVITPDCILEGIIVSDGLDGRSLCWRAETAADRTSLDEDMAFLNEVFGTATIESPLLRAEEGTSCDFTQSVTAKIDPRLFGGPAVQVVWTRGFASPNLFGFAFVGDIAGIVLRCGLSGSIVIADPVINNFIAGIVPNDGRESSFYARSLARLATEHKCKQHSRPYRFNQRISNDLPVYF